MPSVLSPKRTKQSKLALFGLVLLLLLTAGLLAINNKPLQAQGGGTAIYATVCDQQPPLLNIVSPQSNEVFSVPSINLSGTTERTTQINISINGSYSQSVAVGLDQVFDTQVTLKKGKNTIVLDSYFSCNQKTSQDQLVVTYKPAPKPVIPPHQDGLSPGGSGSAGDEEFLGIFNPAIYAGGDAQTIKKPTKDSTDKSRSPAERAKDNLGFGEEPTGIKDSIVIPLVSWLSLAIAAGALFVAFAPRTLTKRLGERLHLAGRMRFLWNISTTILRLVALAIALIFLFIVQL